LIYISHLGETVMALSLAGLAAIAQAGALGLKGGAWALDKFQRWRDPEGMQRKDIFKQLDTTPEQYELRRQTLEQALSGMRTPQQVFAPAQARMLGAQDITAGLPQQVGGIAIPQRPGGLLDILGTMDAQARSGYESDLARIGAMRGPARNPVGRTSGTLGMRLGALRERGQQLAQNRFQLLADYANSNQLAQLEALRTNIGQQRAQTQLQDFLANMQRQQQAGIQQGYLAQQQQNIGEAGLRNIMEAERYRQGTQRFRIGQQAPYSAQTMPEGV